jgi:deazaflavin-dependent oxidoreductase (nitroreductase family)
MTTHAAPAGRRIPSIVSTLNPLVRRLLRLGMPMGQNALLTVRGRKSGQLRSFPVTLTETVGHRYVFSAFGEVNWVHNLRASGEATVKQGRREDAVVAVELAPEVAAPIMEAGFKPFLKIKGFGSLVGGWYGLTAESSSADYLAAARGHACFELLPAH